MEFAVSPSAELDSATLGSLEHLQPAGKGAKVDDRRYPDELDFATQNCFRLWVKLARRYLTYNITQHLRRVLSNNVSRLAGTDDMTDYGDPAKPCSYCIEPHVPAWSHHLDIVNVSHLIMG